MKHRLAFRIRAAAGIGILMLFAVACGGSSSTPAPTAAPSGGGSTAGAQANMVIQADMVMGHVCNLDNVYARGSEVVWRAKVLGGANDSDLDDSQVKSLVVKLADGQTFPMKYGSHPSQNPTDNFWTASWTIPDTYPTGVVNYTITATDSSGNTATYKPFNSQPSLLTVTAAGTPTATP